jgi:hypothetical protein
MVVLAINHSSPSSSQSADIADLKYRHHQRPIRVGLPHHSSWPPHWPLPTSTLSDMGLGLNIPAAQRNIPVDEAFAVIHRML